MPVTQLALFLLLPFHDREVARIRAYGCVWQRGGGDLLVKHHAARAICMSLFVTQQMRAL